MASRSTPSPDPTSQSYTKIQTADYDVDAIGKHCQLDYCHQLDFLPFRCESCKGVYCLDHRSETAHKCPKEGAWLRARREAALKSSSPQPDTTKIMYFDEQPCGEPECNIRIYSPQSVGVLCETCRRHYCLKHRFREDHACATLVAAKQSTTTKAGLAALDRLRAWGAGKKAAAAASTTTLRSKSKSSPSNATSTAARLKAVNEIKRTAKGNAKTPAEKRVYLHVEASADTTVAKFPTGNFFYDKEWSVGRVLDEAAKALQVTNVNNRGGGEEERLRVFHVEGGRLLEFGERVGKVTATGNTIVLLRGVGPPQPDLIEL
ncbi:hypothetical protein K490DRAFT_70345 [Saccharata proteae CBS 121410]|uniref:AN1-type domain-containing protein n=1 Tax=Saccharata proteae CBS 121410 TaxID=1314787 RepID=A0A9P4I2Z3_9PEZI|nr:hypothetical protein K490DRAFT_70345 [Saccharata proteae CBS 121410]